MSSPRNKSTIKLHSARRRLPPLKKSQTLQLQDLKVEAIQEVLFDQPHINHSQLKQDGVDFHKIERMTKLDDRQQDEFLIYPESSKKAAWDLFMTFILLVTCFKSPYDIAFTSDDTI